MVFGAGEFNRLGELAAEYGSRPLVVVGRSHAENCGFLDRGLKLLREAGLDPVVSGVEPNPKVSTCQNAARLAKENNCDMVVAIGGGSVMDAGKIVAFGVFDPDGIWKRVAHWNEGHEHVKEALPIILAGTLAATGSEGNAGAVVTNDETLERAGVFSGVSFPPRSA